MKKRILCLFIFALTTTLLFVFTRANAEVNTGEGLTISPPISEPKINPGESIEATIRITNPTTNMVVVYPQAMDLKAKGEDGQPAFYNAAEAGSGFSLASWISFNPAKIALMPEQVVDFVYTLSVPVDAEPGGHYGAVFFVSDPNSSGSGSQVAIGSMIGSLILVEVPGDINEKGNLVEFSTDSKLYFKGDTVNIATRIGNVGNIHFRPIGNINVKNIFGNQVGNFVFNEQEGNVLPESTRKFENSWNYNWKNIGKYTVNLGIIYGEKGGQIIGTCSFWIIPYWLIIAVVVLILLIVAFTFWLLRKRKKRKIKQNQTSYQPPKNTNDINRPGGGRPPVILR